MGKVFTATTAKIVVLHPFESIPFTKYVVVKVGSAVTDEPVVLFNPMDGAHV